MKILVQKFGGTSVAKPEAREKVNEKILAAKSQGYNLVVVISAMGRKGAPYATDTLLELGGIDNPGVRKRELDIIFNCGEIISGVVITTNLQKQGYEASCLTGMQAGIITNKNFGDARILRVETEKIYSLLEKGQIVVVAGGQGGTSDGEITSLGRGGSDTTACALGVALDAEGIEIYTDVEGIMTADPRIVKSAKILNEISYKFCCDMAKQGAKVIHPRAVEIASQNPRSKLRLRSTFSDFPGTLIGSSSNMASIGSDIHRENEPIGITKTDDQTIYVIKALAKGKKIEIVEKLLKAEGTVIDIHPNDERLTLISEEKDEKFIEETILSSKLEYVKFSGLSKLCLIGNDLSKLNEIFLDVFKNLEKKGIDIIANHVENDYIAVWVDSDLAIEGMNALHKIIEERL